MKIGYVDDEAWVGFPEGEELAEDRDAGTYGIACDYDPCLSEGEEDWILLVALALWPSQATGLALCEDG